MFNERYELLTRIASMYFEEGLTQKEIEGRTGYSRSMVSRMLTEARAQGLVEIRIHHPLERRTDLEQALQEELGLQIARVLARGTLSDGQMVVRIGALSARLLEELIHDDMTIGVSWGTTLLETVNALRSKPYANVHVVQMVGLMGLGDPQVDGGDLARRLARAFSGHYSLVPVPFVVDSPATRRALLEDERIQRAFKIVHKADLALMGIGTLEPKYCSLLQHGFLNGPQVKRLVKAGAVGDACGIFMSLDGRIVETPLSRRVVGIMHENLVPIPLRMGVAGGQSKAAPILGAIRAQLINVLVTDEVAAYAVLELQRARGLKEKENGHGAAVHKLRRRSAPERSAARPRRGRSKKEDPTRDS